MAGLSSILESALLNAVFTQQTFPHLARIWLSLHSADPSDTGANEVNTALGYARKEVTGYFLPTASDKISNILEVVFIAATSQYSASHWGIWGISSEGDETLFYYSGSLTAGSDTLLIQVGHSPSFPVGTLVATVD